MKVQIPKLEAAERQLITAIHLFFAEKDPVSIHTLAAAALGILHDHISEDEVWKHDLIFHYHSIYIKDEAKALWSEKIREAANFFKHADKDLKKGKIEIEFDAKLTESFIFEALNCLRIVLGDQLRWLPELRIFTAWYVINHPHLLNEEGHKQRDALLMTQTPTSKAEYKKIIELLYANPTLLKEWK